MSNSDNDNDLASLSVNDSSIQILSSGEKKSIRKITRLNEKFKTKISTVFDFTLIYIEKLKNAGILLPDIYDAYFTEDKLVFECEYVGENILHSLDPESFSETIKNKRIFPFIFDCLKNAQNADINFDPHPKNYVLQDGYLTYVDFTPPWYQDYYDLRIETATNPLEKSILKDFFECFHPSNIGYHLGGVMLKMNHLLEDKLPLLFDELLKEGIVSGNYDNFIERAKEIKRREILREESEFYLL